MVRCLPPLFFQLYLTIFFWLRESHLIDLSWVWFPLHVSSSYDLSTFRILLLPGFYYSHFVLVFFSWGLFSLGPFRPHEYQWLHLSILANSSYDFFSPSNLPSWFSGTLIILILLLLTSFHSSLGLFISFRPFPHLLLFSKGFLHLCSCWSFPQLLLFYCSDVLLVASFFLYMTYYTLHVSLLAALFSFLFSYFHLGVIKVIFWGFTELVGAGWSFTAIFSHWAWWVFTHFPHLCLLKSLLCWGWIVRVGPRESCRNQTGASLPSLPFFS